MGKKNIAIVAGGDSSEYVISVKSGANVIKAINTELFSPWLVRIKGEEWCLLDGDVILTKLIFHSPLTELNTGSTMPI
jgi:D-alanine-D-alanine ligase